MKISFFTFEKFHNKTGVGSTMIRVHNLLKYWPEASLYKYGENPDVLIFQKVYCSEDYKFPANFKGLKILDVCDPDWLEGTPIKETVDAMDAVVCPTQPLVNFIKQLTDKPVIVIPDRYDMVTIPKPKKHHEKAKTVAWFGYRHNAETLKPALNLINELGLKLLVISDDNPLVWQWLHGPDGDKFRDKNYIFKKYEESTFYRTLQKADFCIFPQGDRPQDIYKSNNKATKSILAGLPVAKNADEIRDFIEPDKRTAWINTKYRETMRDYDCKMSVKEYEDLINDLLKSKH
jgi:hypothetical protein